MKTGRLTRVSKALGEFLLTGAFDDEASTVACVSLRACALLLDTFTCVTLLKESWSVGCSDGPHVLPAFPNLEAHDSIGSPGYLHVRQAGNSELWVGTVLLLNFGALCFHVDMRVVL